MAMTPRVVLVDNYDSFTYNLFQYLAEHGAEVLVHRHDAIDIDGIEALAPTHLVISPGPKTPDQAGISLEAIRHFAGVVPVLGVCLGHQAIGQAFGGTVIRGTEPVHGKTSEISPRRQDPVCRHREPDDRDALSLAHRPG